LRSRTARIVLFVLALLVPAVLAACGSSGNSSSSSSSEDPQKVLDETFNNDQQVNSGNLALNVSVEATGTQSGNLTASLDGPFQSDANDKTAFPQLDLTAKVSGSGGGQNVDFQGGVTATSDAAFITYNDQAYAVPDSTFQQFKAAYEQQAQSTQGSGSQNASSLFDQLGIDPSTWLTNVTNEGTTDVNGESTIHISGDADVQQILTDLSKAVQNVPGAAAQGIDPSQFSQASQFIKDAHIDIYSGADDHILRKLDISLDIAPPPSAASGITDLKIDFSVGVSDVNSPQTITAPTDTKPLSDLQQQLGGVGILGGLGGTSGTSTTPSTGGASSAAQKKFQQCVIKAQASGNAAAANKCLALLQ
jgi:hypothetical protein